MNTHTSPLPRRTLLASLAALATGLQGCRSAPAAPDLSRFALSRPVGPTVAETESKHYRFESFQLPSADGQRQYRVQLAIPLAAPPAGGYPLLYLLDGNAAFAALTPEQLAEQAHSGRPVAMAAIGYDTQLAVDVDARAYDYTPPVRTEGPTYDDEARGRIGGGANIFLDLLQQRIRPEVEKRVPANPLRQTLWGHSYGGLLVLHTLFTRPQMFPRYAAADASLWWHGGFILTEETQAAPLPAQHRTQLLLMAGSSAQEVASAAPRPLRPGIDPAVAAAALARRRALPPDAAQRLAERLQQRPRLAVDWREFPGVSHGPMRPASIPPTLQFASA